MSVYYFVRKERSQRINNFFIHPRQYTRRITFVLKWILSNLPISPQKECVLCRIGLSFLTALPKALVELWTWGDLKGIESKLSFIWLVVILQDENCHVPYLKNFLKKLIREVESTGGSLLDEFYERYACYMTSLKVSLSNKGASRSFFFGSSIELHSDLSFEKCRKMCQGMEIHGLWNAFHFFLMMVRPSCCQCRCQAFGDFVSAD